MIGLALPGIRRVLCLGAHSDDIEIGCGGTILSLAATVPDLEVQWVVFSGSETRRREAEDGARRFLQSVARTTVVIHDFPDGFLPYAAPVAVKLEFERLKTVFEPDLVLTHYRGDAHQDHRFVADLTWNTFRDHLIFEYEIPKYDGDLGTPGVFVPLEERICRDKVHHILEAFKSQHGRRWFSGELFMSLLRIRGMEANAPSSYAEAFYGRKLRVGLR